MPRPRGGLSSLCPKNRKASELELGLKEQVKAGGAGRSYPRGLRGLQRSLDLIPSARDPPPRKSHSPSLVSPTSWSRWDPQKPSVAGGKDSVLLRS